MSTISSAPTKAYRPLAVCVMLSVPPSPEMKSITVWYVPEAGSMSITVDELSFRSSVKRSVPSVLIAR